MSNIKKDYPDFIIEAYDRIRGGLSDYRPVYYQDAGEIEVEEDRVAVPSSLMLIVKAFFVVYKPVIAALRFVIFLRRSLRG